MAVQWRTETSRGDLSECYTRYVAPAIEDFLHYLDLRRDQVFFNVDLIGQASTTYNASVSEHYNTAFCYQMEEQVNADGFPIPVVEASFFFGSRVHELEHEPVVHRDFILIYNVLV